MKKNDISIIVIIVVFSLGLSYALFSFIVFPPKKRSIKVESVSGISKDFTLPNERYFNIDSINPTKPTGINADSAKNNITTEE